MNKVMNEDNHDALFAAWSDDRKAETPRPLAQWLTEHPHMEADLLQWTGQEPVMRYAEQIQPDAVMEERVAYIGNEVLATLRAQLTPAIPKSLLEQAKKQGLSPKKLAERLSVGMAVVGKLQQRLLQVTSIPAELLDRMADALDLSVVQVRGYLSLPPTLASGADYKADAAPRVLPQETFEEAIRTCSDMPEPHRTFWLETAKKDT